MKCVNKNVEHDDGSINGQKVNWQFYVHFFPLHRNLKLPGIFLSDLHYAADGLHRDFPSITCHAGSFD